MQKPTSFALVFPTNYVSIKQYFKSSHQAIDIVYSSLDKKYINKYIYASWDGKITKNSFANDKGNYIEVSFGNGYVMQHCHLKVRSPLKVGTQVKFWDILGEMGSTGNSSGPHDHCILWYNGARKDPCKYLVRMKEQPAHPDEVKRITLYEELPALPKPIERNENVNQISCDGSKINCRTEADLDGTRLGYMPKGYYNVIQSKVADNYTWYEVEKDKWCAKVDGVVFYKANDEVAELKKVISQANGLAKEIVEITEVV